MKEINYNVKRIINTIPLDKNYVAYKDDVYIDNELKETIEGITLSATIKKLALNEKIANSEKFWLHKKEIRKLIRTNAMTDEGMKAIYECLVKLPYSYAEQNGLEDVELLHMSWYDHNLYDLNKNRQPKAIYFDYIDGQIDNSCFNLEEVLSTLSSRDDIKLSTNGIVDIPYYNADEDRDKYIAFTWQPTDEDWEKVKNIKDSFSLRTAILKDILGLTRKESQY